MLPLARGERLKADIWERKLKQFGTHSALQKKVSDCNSEPLVWQFVLTDEHWIKMGVTEIQQSCYACASVGVSAHQVGSHPLQALKPLSSEHAWGEPPLGGWQQLSCFGSGASHIGQRIGTYGQHVRSGVGPFPLAPFPLAPPSPGRWWPGWLQVLQGVVQQQAYKPQAPGDHCRAKCLFIHICAALLDLPLNSLHSCRLCPRLTTL